MILGTPLDRYLDPGEQLVWSGQPKQGVRLQAFDLFLIPFSLVWAGFAFFWEASVLGLVSFEGGPTRDNHPPLFFAIWGIPFCLIGLYMVVGRFFGDAVSRRRTWHGVTDKRVIVLKSFFSTTVTSVDYANLTNLNLVERKDNSGDILFSFPVTLPGYAGDDGMRSRRYPRVPGFYLLPQARTTYNLIRELQQKARAPK
jgi:hypothetical protein